MAEIVEFRVTICEPRKAFLLKQESFSSNLAIKNCLPDDLIHAEFSNNYTAIVCLAHDPKVDDMALIEALSQSKAFYIGAMGSLKTTKNRLDRLKKFGLSEFHLQKLKAPIGINIHSKTPQEIAVSILADLISHRHEHKLSLNTRQK